MPVASNALCSLSQARSYLRKLIADVADDDVLEPLIDAASTAIIAHTGREFAPASATLARSFVYDGEGFLGLAPYDLRSVTSITLDTESASPTIIAATDYRLRPSTPRWGVYTHLKGLPRRSCESEVTINGQWGFASVPASIRLAAQVQVAAWYRGGVAGFSRSFDIETQQWSGGEGLASTVMRLVQPFKRGGLG